MSATPVPARHQTPVGVMKQQQENTTRFCPLLTLQVVRPQLQQLLCHKLQDVLRDGPLVLSDLFLPVGGHLLVALQPGQTILQQPTQQPTQQQQGGTEQRLISTNC